jgi:pre-mRNA cleavage complex 2 protein Pcf11
MRFAEGSIGKKKMDDHLDMHFRQNRRSTLAVGRGHSRSWFISIQVKCLTFLRAHNLD